MGFRYSKTLTPVSTPTQLNALTFRRYLYVAVLGIIMVLQPIPKYPVGKLN